MPATQHFAYALIPPRPTFAADMTDAERAVMGRHAVYWQGLVDAGRVVVFGPVLDPAGVWGLAVVAAADAADVRALGAADPAVTSGLATFAVHPMPGAVVRPGPHEAPPATTAA
jgi:uncharacterized protein YciI